MGEKVVKKQKDKIDEEERRINKYILRKNKELKRGEKKRKRQEEQNKIKYKKILDNQVIEKKIRLEEEKDYIR